MTTVPRTRRLEATHHAWGRRALRTLLVGGRALACMQPLTPHLDDFPKAVLAKNVARYKVADMDSRAVESPRNTEEKKGWETGETPEKGVIEEREKTDSSLHHEREKTDDLLASRSVDSGKVMDDAVALAREQADRQVQEVRQEAGLITEMDERSANEQRVWQNAIADERATADNKIQNQRSSQLEDLRRLLDLEREETNEHLDVERARADEAVASRDEFLAIVSHDLRNLVGAMGIALDVLVTTSPEGLAGDRTRAEAQRIRRLTQRMSRLIADLLDVVSIESGKLTVMPIPQDVMTVLEETIEVFQNTALARRIRMKSESSCGRVVTTFDRDRIVQVLMNLVGNAMKFVNPEGNIVLALARTDAGVQITVRDDGCGIAADQLGGIFERYSQASQTDRRGLGLGLFIARGIILAHGGKIWVESEVGKGSAFHCLLPIA